MNRDRGFTLIELMVTIAVAAVLLSLAVPAFSNVLSNNRLATRTNEFVSALSYARSEAIKRGRPTAVCRSGNSGGANTALWTCSTGSGGWEDGWFVYEDTDGSGTADSGEPRLRGKGGMANALYTMRGNNNVANRVRFSDQGMALGSNGTITVCDTHRGVSRQIVVAVTGRAQVPDGPGTCS